MDKVDNTVTAFHMTLFAQKMEQNILAVIDLIQLGRNVAQLSFSADIIEIHREKARQLFGNIVDRLDAAIEKARNIPWEKVRILDENAAHGNVDNQIRHQARRAFGA